MLETRGLFALEYSPQKHAWRIADLEVVLTRNLGWFAMGEPGGDYRILAISESREQLRAFRQSLNIHKAAVK